MFCIRQFPFRGQLSMYLQLQDFYCLLNVPFKTLELFCVMRFFKIVVRLQLSSMDLVLKLLLNLWCFGNHFLMISFMNCVPLFSFIFSWVDQPYFFSVPLLFFGCEKFKVLYIYTQIHKKTNLLYVKTVKHKKSHIFFIQI